MSAIVFDTLPAARKMRPLSPDQGFYIEGHL